MSTTAVPAAPRPKVPKDPLYQPPAVAWPTLLLFFAALTLWFTGLHGALTGWLPPAVAIAIQTVAAFMHFTVLHDGVHRSFMRGHPLLNDVIATIAGSFLGPVVTGAASAMCTSRITATPTIRTRIRTGGAAWARPGGCRCSGQRWT